MTKKESKKVVMDIHEKYYGKDGLLKKKRAKKVAEDAKIASAVAPETSARPSLRTWSCGPDADGRAAVSVQSLLVSPGVTPAPVPAPGRR